MFFIAIAIIVKHLVFKKHYNFILKHNCKITILIAIFMTFLYTVAFTADWVDLRQTPDHELLTCKCALLWILQLILYI